MFVPRLVAAPRRGRTAYVDVSAPAQGPPCSLAELASRLRGRLHELAGLPAERWRLSLLPGSGPDAVSAAIAGFVYGRVLVIDNGLYCRRLAAVAAPHADEVSVLRCGDGMSPDPDSLRAAMQSGSPDWVLVVHHEAMTGLLNPLDAIVRASAAQGAHVLVDAVGSFGVHPVDGGPDVVCFSSDKALGADPGLAGFFWRRELRPVYIDTVGGPDSRRRPSVGYPIARPPAGYALGAPPDVDPAALFSLERAVHPVLAYSRPVRCRRAAEQVWSAGSRHFRPLLPRGSRSHLLTAFLLDGRDPAELARRAAALGQPILPGQAWLAGQVFRVPHVGSLTTDEAEELFSSLAR